MAIWSGKRRFLLFAVINYFILIFSPKLVYGEATKLIWDKPDFRCGDICLEMERGYKIYTKIAGEDYTLKKEITDPDITECDLSELFLTSGKSNYIVIEAYKKSGDYVCASTPSDEIVWEDIKPGSPAKLSSIPGLGIVIDNQIIFSWDAAIDTGGSGLAGYRAVLDTEPLSEPNSVDKLISANTISIGIINLAEWVESPSDKEYFLHIRAADEALNLGTTLHYGPIKFNLSFRAVIAYSQPSGRPYTEGGAFTAKDGKITITAVFTEGLSDVPKIAIDFAGSGENLLSNMTETDNNLVWTYPMTIPSGSTSEDEKATITIVGENAKGNPLGIYIGNKFMVDNDPPNIPKNFSLNP